MRTSHHRMALLAGWWACVAVALAMLAGAVGAAEQGQTAGAESMAIAGKNPHPIPLPQKGEGTSQIATTRPGATQPAALLDVNKLELAELIGDPRFRHAGPVFRVQVIDQGKEILSSGGDGTARLWDAATEKELQRYRSPAGTVPQVWALSDGQRLLVCARENRMGRPDAERPATLTLLDRQSGKPIRTMNQEGGPAALASLALAPDDKKFFAGDGQGGITQWNIETGEKAGTWDAHKGSVVSLAVAPDAQALVSGGEDKTIAIWDAPTGKLRHRVAGHTDTITDLAFPPTGQRFASTSTDKTARLWDAAEGKQVWSAPLPDGGIRLAFSPDGQALAVMCGDGTLRLLNAADGKERLVIDTKDPAAGPKPIAFGNDGKDLFIGVASTICRWDTQTGQRLFPPAEAGDSIALGVVAALAVSPDGRRLFSVGEPGRVLAWDVARRRVAAAWALIPKQWGETVELSPDGMSLLAGTRFGGAVVLDAATGQRRRSLTISTEQSAIPVCGPWFWGQDGGQVMAGSGTGVMAVYDAGGGAPHIDGDSRHPGNLLAVSDDGRWGAVGTYREGLGLWNIPRGERLSQITVPGADAAPRVDLWRQAAFMPGGAMLLTAGEDKLLRAWGRSVPSGAKPDDVTFWVANLGAAAYDVREEATTQLIQCGPAAEHILAQAQMNDEEVKTRAGRIRLAWEKQAAPDQPVGRPLDLKGPITRLGVHPDGRHWAAIVGPPEWWPQIVLGDVTSAGPRERRRLNDDHGARSVAFSPDGRTLYTGNGDATIGVWEMGD